MQMAQYVLLQMLLLVVVSTTVGSASQTVYPSGAGVTAAYNVSPLTVAVTDTLLVEQWLVNRSAGDVTGLYFTFQLPEGLTPIGRLAVLDGVPVTIAAERSVGPTQYSSWRVVLDSPLGTPDVRLAPGDSAHVYLPVRIGAAGQYAIPVLGATFAAGGEAHFSINGMEPVAVTAVGTSCCVKRGDIDGGGSITVADLTYLVNLFFRAGPSAPCPVEADVNGLDGKVTVADLTFLVNLLFRSGPQPPPCQ